MEEQRLNEFNELDEFYLKAYEFSSIYKEMNKYYDQKIEKLEFAVGDFVLLFNSRLRLFPGISPIISFLYHHSLHSHLLKFLKLPKLSLPKFTCFSVVFRPVITVRVRRLLFIVNITTTPLRTEGISI